VVLSAGEARQQTVGPLGGCDGRGAFVDDLGLDGLRAVLNLRERVPEKKKWHNGHNDDKCATPSFLTVWVV